jgi:hypothetical protein
MSDSREGFLAGGNFITDYVKVIDAWPEQDTLASIRSESTSNGANRQARHPAELLRDALRDLPEAVCYLGEQPENGPSPHSHPSFFNRRPTQNLFTSSLSLSFFNNGSRSRRPSTSHFQAS